MLKRPVNVGFSGGEKKRAEMVQMGIMDPRFAVLDETDSGLDIDALKAVGAGINAIMRAPDKGVLLITHYQRLLDYVKPDRVHVLSRGPDRALGRPRTGARARARRLCGGGGMTALPTRKLEAYRYADIDALASVWDELAPPSGSKLLRSKSCSKSGCRAATRSQVRRVEIVARSGRDRAHFRAQQRARYGRIELDVTLHEGARFRASTRPTSAAAIRRSRSSPPSATSSPTRRRARRSAACSAARRPAPILGKVAVAREGQQTDAEQSVKAMLLDRGATANAKPELEIYADDVKCAHGATVGELDANQLFYAAARGLDPASARALLLEGFVGGLWDEHRRRRSGHRRAGARSAAEGRA